MKNIIVLSNPRSGSTHLYDLLSLNHNSIFGKEPFYLSDNYTENLEYKEMIESDPNKFIEYIPKENELFTVQYWQIADKIKIDFDYFLNNFKNSYFIILYRENVLEQFISASLSLETQNWHHYDHDIKIKFNIHKFRSYYYDQIKRSYEFFKKYLDKHSINYEKIAYKNNKFDTDDLERIRKFCNLPKLNENLRYKKQRKKDILEYISNPEEVNRIKSNYLLEI